MRFPPITRGAGGALLAVLCALTASACGTSVSTSGFKGEQHAVAQAIANFQSAASASEQGKICSTYLAASVKSDLDKHGGCEQAIKKQLGEVDNFDLTVKSIAISPKGTSATAQVSSTVAGKKRTTSVALVKEGSQWKLTSLA